jgi:predicted esterase
VSGAVHERSIAATVHGTYLVAPPAGDAEPAALVVGFHGYGERAEHHLAAMRRIHGAGGWLLCAVQGLHPFYKKSGEVVAGWMTRFDRDRAIVDNVAYVAAVVAALRAEFPGAGPLVYTGFSQGVAMAYRAAAGAGHRAAALVVLAGDVPPEVGERDDLAAVLPPVLVGAGARDGWYGAAELDRDLALLRTKGVEAEGLRFDGGHEWTDEFLARAGAFLAGRLS